MNSTIRTILLFGIFGVLIIGIGRLVGGTQGVFIAGIFAVGMNFFAYFFSDKIALKSANAEPLSKSQYPEIHTMVKELSKKAGIPKPKVYTNENPNANAFATGRNPKNASVLVTYGLLRNLDSDEIRGVIAHELSHIKNRDILIQTLAAVFASVITGVAGMLRWAAIFGMGGDENRPNPIALLVTIIVAPMAALIIQMAISRQREYLADKTGAELSKDPNGLADALERITALGNNKLRGSGEVNPAFENLYIANPFSAGDMGDALGKLFSTHPPMDERVERLRKMS